MPELYGLRSQSIDDNDIESDVLSESDDEVDISTPTKSKRPMLDGFSPLSGWEGAFSPESKVNAPSSNLEPQFQQSDDHEEDEIESDGDEDDEHQSFDDEEENYKRFLQSVRFNGDENSVGMMDASFLFDEDLDEEEYVPEEEAADEGSEDTDDEQDDVTEELDDLMENHEDDNIPKSYSDQNGSDSPYYGFPVRRKELAGLLGDCWLAIAGDNNNDVDGPTNTGSGGSHGPVLQSHSLLSSLMAQFFTGNKMKEPLIDGFPIAVYRKILARQMSMAIQLLLQMLIQAEDRSHAFVNSYQYLLQFNNHRLNAVKKAALLQMNMETFLAVKQQQAAFQSGLGQAPLEPRLVKQNQIQALMEEVAPHLVQKQSSVGDTSSAPLGGSRADRDRNLSFRPSQPSYTNGPGGYPPPQPPPPHQQLEPFRTQQHRVTTRSSLINYNAQSRRSSSVLDVPILGDFNKLLDCVDKAQKTYKAQVLHFAVTNGMAQIYNNQVLLSNTASSNDSYRHFLLQASATQLEEVYRSMNNAKLWKSLVPTFNYPLPDRVLQRIDPSTIIGKTFVTPSEDDLLVRGLIRYGDQKLYPQQTVDMNGMVQIFPGHNPWTMIRQEFLPTRNENELEFHYHQRTSAVAASLPVDLSLGTHRTGFDLIQTQNTGNNIFKRFQWARARGWIVEKRLRDRQWQHPEDINLLRGFQVFGHKWPLLAKVYLPHRNIKEVRIRWRAFLRLWARTFPNFEQRAQEVIFEDQALTSSETFDPHRAVLESLVSPKLQAFLQDIQECSSYSTLIALRDKGAGRHMLAFEHQTGPVLPDSISLRPQVIGEDNHPITSVALSSLVSSMHTAPLYAGMSHPLYTGSIDRGGILSMHPPGREYRGPVVSTTTTAAATAPATSYSTLTRVHDVFDFDHTQWADISCDELSDDDGPVKESSQRKKSHTKGKGKQVSYQYADSDREEEELGDSSDDEEPPRRPPKAQHQQATKSVASSSKASHSASRSSSVHSTNRMTRPTGATSAAIAQPKGVGSSVGTSSEHRYDQAISQYGVGMHNSHTIDNASTLLRVSQTVGQPYVSSTAMPSVTPSLAGLKRPLNEAQLAQSFQQSLSEYPSSGATSAVGSSAKRSRTVMDVAQVAPSTSQMAAEHFHPDDYHQLPVDDAPPSVQGLDMPDASAGPNSHMGIEELLGFSNFTRDMSRIRADILAEEQQSAVGGEEKSSNAVDVQSVTNKAKDASSRVSRGLFASVMSGAK